MELPDYYKVLEVPEDASQDLIKKKYHDLAHTYHPDKQGDISPELRELTKQKFTEINEAYKVLLDPVQRSEYDRKRKEAKDEREIEAALRSIQEWINRGNLREAIKLASELYERFPDNTEVNKIYTDTVLLNIQDKVERGNLRGAVDLARKAHERFPRNTGLRNLYAALLYDLAMVFVKEGREDEAKSYLELVVSITTDEDLRRRAEGDLNLISERRRAREEERRRREKEKYEETTRPRAKEEDHKEEKRHSKEEEKTPWRSVKEEAHKKEGSGFGTLIIIAVIVVIGLVLSNNYWKNFINGSSSIRHEERTETENETFMILRITKVARPSQPRQPINHVRRGEEIAIFWESYIPPPYFIQFNYADYVYPINKVRWSEAIYIDPSQGTYVWEVPYEIVGTMIYIHLGVTNEKGKWLVKTQETLFVY